MLNQPDVNFGFYGSDVVEGFRDFVTDLLGERNKPFDSYPGLVYRKSDGTIVKNSENPAEYSCLSLVDYSLSDSIVPHNQWYLAGQQKTYRFMRGKGLKSQVVDIGRGCIKFTGPRSFNIPDNACDFCGIIPGGKAISSKGADRAWHILHNAFRQGYNYFYITTDELPLTLWGLLSDMAGSLPEWYLDLRPDERPKMFGYARAEGFDTHPKKIETLVKVLGFDHFFVGFDGLSEISLDAMNKRPVGAKTHDLMRQNIVALQRVVQAGCLVTAGIVVTHLGITPEVMKENYEKLEEIVTAHPATFAALDFGPLCPIPGSQSFRYLTHPEYAAEKATKYGLSINREYLDSIREKYLTGDCWEMDELVDDFVRGCCPAVTPELVKEYLNQITALAEKHSIVIGGGV